MQGGPPGGRFIARHLLASGVEDLRLR